MSSDPTAPSVAGSSGAVSGGSASASAATAAAAGAAGIAGPSAGSTGPRRGTAPAARTTRIPVPSERSPYPLLRGPDTGGSHSYCLIPGEGFQVRGPRYHADKVKVASGPSVFELMHIDLFLSKSRIGNIAARRQSWLRLARDAGDHRFYLVIAYVTPAPPHLHVAFYYAVDDERLAANPNLQRLWRRFTAHGPEADEFRNERWKVIPRIAEGAWIVQRAVGSKPALLGTKLTHTWILSEPEGSAGAAAAVAASSAHSVPTSDAGCDAGLGLPARMRGHSYAVTHGPGPYLEGDCDIASSNMAFVLVSLLLQYAKHIVIDLGFAIEAREEDELPEAVLGTVRLSRIDVVRPPLVDAMPDDWVLGKPGTLHGEEGEKAKDGSES